jgi:hypothetical protein
MTRRTYITKNPERHSAFAGAFHNLWRMHMSATALKVVQLEYDRFKPTELKLVRKCVECGAAMAADDASYCIDPDWNNTSATSVASAYAERVDELLGEIARTPALTIDGVQAKAKLAGVLLKWLEPDGIWIGGGTQDRPFLKSFAADVDRYLEATRKQAEERVQS